MLSTNMLQGVWFRKPNGLKKQEKPISITNEAFKVNRPVAKLIQVSTAVNVGVEVLHCYLLCAIVLHLFC